MQGGVRAAGGDTRLGGTRGGTTEVDRISPWEIVLVFFQLCALAHGMAQVMQLILHLFVAPTLSQPPSFKGTSVRPISRKSCSGIALPNFDLRSQAFKM